jgi:hypothetical protein
MNASQSPPEGALQAERHRRECRRLAMLFLLSPLIGLPLFAQTEAGSQRVALSAGPAAERARSMTAIWKGLEFLRSRQLDSGGVGSRYTVATTSLTGLALLGAGVQPYESQGNQYGEMLRKCLGYLLSLRKDFLTEGSASGAESLMHGHCFAILFLTQIAGSLPAETEREVAGVIKRGILVIERAQSRAGGWYYQASNIKDEDEASVTVCALQALRAADDAGFLVDKARIDAALGYVKKCQMRDGSFRYSLGTTEGRGPSFALTAAAVSTLNAAGVYESPELRLGLDFLRRGIARHRQNPARAAGQEFFYYGNLYAGQAFFQEGGAAWNDWYPKVRDHFNGILEQKGRCESRFGDEYATAAALLILELPLGYLPIFQR